MDTLKSIQNNPIARAGAYIVYNIPPVQIAMGIVRIAIAAGCAIAHQVYSWQVKQDYDDRKAQRENENEKGGIFTRLGNTVEGGVDYLATKAVRKGTHIWGMHDQDARIKNEAKRALGEICVVGAWYYTYSDYRRNASVWGLASLVSLMDKEEQLYATVQGMRKAID